MQGMYEEVEATKFKDHDCQSKFMLILYKILRFFYVVFYYYVFPFSILSLGAALVLFTDDFTFITSDLPIVVCAEE